jgi:hypothetical protein
MISRVLPVVFIIIAIAIVLTYVQPTYAGAIAEVRDRIKSYDSALKAADDFKEQEAKLAAARGKMDPGALARLALLLPDDVDNVQLILDLDALAARAGVRLSDFTVTEPVAATTPQQQVTAAAAASPGQPAPAATVDTAAGARALQSNGTTDTLELSVKATGTYAAFRSFLASAEKSLRLLDVTEITLDSENDGIYTYAITFRIYSLH